MQTGAKPKATDDRRDFVVIPPDQVRVAPSDAEITDLLRAAARHHSEAGVRADPDPSAPVPVVDTTFRATAVNEDVPARGPTIGRRLMRAVAALLLAAGIGAAALTWQTFGYAAKKALVKWAPKLALTSSLPLDKLGLAAESKPSDDPADATPAQAAAAPAQTAADPAQNAADSGAPENAVANTAAPSSDTSQQLQSMAHDLATANQEIETLKASLAELKAGQQQMARDLAKASDKAAEQNAKAKVASVTQHAAAAVRKPAPLYSPPTPTAAPGYRPVPSSYSTQAAMPQASPPATAQPYAPPPTSLQPQADPGLPPIAPRPPMPVQ
jgi:hypothetical protein